MATSFIKQAQSQLNPVYNTQIKQLQSQIPAIQQLYDTLTSNLQQQNTQQLNQGVQNIAEDASARGVLRSTLPVDARTQLTGDLGAALNQGLAQLASQKGQDLYGIQSAINDANLSRTKDIYSLADTLLNQDLSKRNYNLEKQKLALAQAQLNAPSSSGGSSDLSTKYSAKQTKTGTSFFDPAGNPITAAQYFNGRGGTAGDLVNFLKNDPNPTSQKALQYLQTNGIQAAIKKYPYIFAGV